MTPATTTPRQPETDPLVADVLDNGVVNDRSGDFAPPLPLGFSVQRPDGSMWCYDTGPAPGPTVVLLHGWNVTAALNWYGCFEPLSDRYRVIAPDLRGHGRGVRSKLPFTLAQCVDDIIGLLDDQGIDQAIIVGYSMGGAMAQLLSHQHPERVAGIVLCATTRTFHGTFGRRLGFHVTDVLGAVANHVPSPIRTTVMETVIAARRKRGGRGDWVRSEQRLNDPHAIAQAWSAVGQFASHTWVNEITVPTAVVVTALDKAVPAHRQRSLANQIPGANVYEIEGAHKIVATEPERFGPVLRRAVDDVAERAPDVTTG